MCICAGSCDQKKERLHSRITGAFGHNIKQLSVRLRVKFIEHDPMDVEAMFGISFSGKYLIKAVCRFVNQPFL